ncbi:helix-turn-helix domain-containing protein [Nocardioidaceae bacterium]|nr:helix-turn-helix domain-containing protein [Nocardioidaceae bacterium]
MRTIAVVVEEGVEAFGLGCLVEVWAEPYHPEDDNPVFDFRLCSSTPGTVRGRTLELTVEESLDWAAGADLVAITPASQDSRPPSAAVTELLQHADGRGADVLAHCSAVFALGEAGLLDGRGCTTHWRFAAQLAQQFPDADVRPDVLYVHDGNVLTGAGSAASLDASLHLMRDRFGARHANAAARRIVVPPHRDGGQAQFIAAPVREVEAETFGPLLDWIAAHLAERLDVPSLARRAMMSERTFARRFRDETGSTPHAWVTGQRVQRAEELLETSSLSVEEVARAVGFGNAATLRAHFGRVRGISPAIYRQRFSRTTGASV